MAHANRCRLRRLRPLLSTLLVATVTASSALAQGVPSTAPATTGPVATPAAEKPYDGPTLTVASLTDVFTLTVEKDYLSLDTKLDPAAQTWRVVTPGLPLHGEVTVTGNEAAPVGIAPVAPVGPDGRSPLRLFRFTTPPDDNGDVTVKTTVMASSNSLDLSQDSEVLGTIRNVQFSQRIPLVFDAADAANVASEPVVRLHVNVSGTDDGVRAPVRLLFTADSFTDLRRQHPLEFSTYVAPLMSLLQQDAVLAPPSAVARRVFTETTGPTTAPATALSTKVTDLITQLGSRDQQARGDAFRALQQLGEPALPVISSLDRSTLSAEQNSLLDLLLSDDTGSAPADTTALATDPMFLLDCLSLLDAPLRAAAFARLKELTGQNDLTYDPTAPDLTRRAQLATVRTKVTEWSATNAPPIQP